MTLRPAALAALALLLAACSPAPPPPAHGVVQQNAGWDRLRAALPADPAGAASRLEAFRREHGLPLEFWTREIPDSLRAGLTVSEHPCGESTFGFVRAIPADHPVLEGELVVEIADDGSVLRTWHIPIDVRVSGIRGDEVIVGFHALGEGAPEVYLAIAPDGGYRVLDAWTPAEGEPVPCPDLPVFAGSDYLGCRALSDGGYLRRIAYQGVCT